MGIKPQFGNLAYTIPFVVSGFFWTLVIIVSKWCVAERMFSVFTNEWMFNLVCLGTRVISKLWWGSYKIIGLITCLYQSEAHFFSTSTEFLLSFWRIQKEQLYRNGIKDGDKGVPNYKVISLQQKITTIFGHSLLDTSFSHPCHVHFSMHSSLYYLWFLVSNPVSHCLPLSQSFICAFWNHLLEKTLCKPQIYTCTVSSTFSISESWLLVLFWWIAFLSNFSTGIFPTHSKPPWTFCLRWVYCATGSSGPLLHQWCSPNTG